MMTDQQMVQVLTNLCQAYANSDNTAIARLEPEATKIGEELNARGGMNEMRRIFATVPNVRGKGTVEMHWGGIGDWRG